MCQIWAWNQGAKDLPVSAAWKVNGVPARRVLYVSSSMGFGHVTRDLAIAAEMRWLVRPGPERVKVPMLVIGGADGKTITLAEVEVAARAYETVR